MIHSTSDKIKVELRGHTALVTVDNPAANTWDTESLPALRDLLLQMFTTSFPNLTQPHLTQLIEQMFQHCRDQAAFEQHLRDFLVQLKEFGDSTDL